MTFHVRTTLVSCVRKRVRGKDMYFKALDLVYKEKFSSEGRKYALLWKHVLTLFDNRDGEKAIGICVLNGVGDTTPELEMLYIKPDYRGKRLSNILIRSAIDLCVKEGADSVSIQVPHKCERMSSILKAFGAEEPTRHFELTVRSGEQHELF